MSDLRERIVADHDYLRAFRHDLHRHPELMYEEHRTSARVCEELDKAEVQYVKGLAGGTGVLGYLPATVSGGKTVALRADMDALPIHEETGVEYSSVFSGKMHACGHDGHTAVLLGAVRALKGETERKNDVLFLFQPAEEGGAGADRMISDGVLDGRLVGKSVDVIYGHHGSPWIDAGEFTVRNGPMMAATDEFKVTIAGRGGHAAMPHRAVDPVVALAQIVTALQSVASRNVSPLDSIVFSVTTLQAGQAHNVIPDTTAFGGTMRTLLPETRELGERRFQEIVTGIAQAMGCTCEIEWKVGYPVTANDLWATERFRNVARGVWGERVKEEEEPTMGGEDFSFYGKHVPACFFYAGLRREGDSDPSGLHTPRFDFNDAVIPACVETFCLLALEDVAP